MYCGIVITSIIDSVGSSRCEQSLIELRVPHVHWTFGKGIEAIWPLASTIWMYSEKKTVHHTRTIVKLLYLEIQIYDLYSYMFSFLFSLKSAALWHGAYITPQTHTNILYKCISSTHTHCMIPMHYLYIIYVYCIHHMSI